MLDRLAVSGEPRVAAIAGKAVKEAAYHARRSADIVVRLGDGTPESHARMQAGVDAIWPYTGELFADDDVDAEAARRGIACSLADLRQPWLAQVRAVLDEATLALPDEGLARHAAYRGGRQGRHTEALGPLLAEMQFLQRAYPGATW
jgi:ring-1,2-phenylacetyl-CoA epoxidase subunit PaaC